MSKAIATPRAETGIHMYITGFLLSISLTIVAYALVMHHGIAHTALIASIIALAVVQCLVQLFFFLHLGHETKPRWRLVVLLTMLLVIGILVAGSIWIMNNLNYRMTPQEINTYLHDQDGL
ncbi:MAG TPA: cytochrome o ubiquinol oxidase subunit IV [Candidatus Saccharimonadales bacterium]|jgi:cytochrome o ubiquinol oxidase operon protein cyoD|nr:cytochrome o ubiquinol oxidase subunit IV [Candidatus Saccharimonadales bacterium]